MTTFSVLLSPAFFLAFAAYSVLSVAVEWLDRWLLEMTRDIPASAWLFEHMLLPALRAFALVVFILLTYPQLYGVASAPPLGEVLASGHGRFMTLVNISFLLSLLIPLLPVFGRMPALVLPIQAIAAASLLFNWWMTLSGITEVHFWPGWTMALSLLVLAIISHEAARLLAHYSALRMRSIIKQEDMQKLVYRGAVLILQAPVIVTYTLSLGHQVQ